MCKVCKEQTRIKNRQPNCAVCDNAPQGGLPRIAGMAAEIAQTTCWMDGIGGINQQAIYMSIDFYGFGAIKHHLNELFLSFCSGVITEKNEKKQS